MKIVENKAANAINKIKARRFKLAEIKWAVEIEGVKTSISSLSRIASGERNASPELEKALLKAVMVMK